MSSAGGSVVVGAVVVLGDSVVVVGVSVVVGGTVVVVVVVVVVGSPPPGGGGGTAQATKRSTAPAAHVCAREPPFATRFIHPPLRFEMRRPSVYRSQTSTSIDDHPARTRA